MMPFERLETLRGRTVLVAGWSARSGLGAGRLLLALGCRVKAWDERPAAELPPPAEGVRLFAGGEGKDFAEVLEGVEGVVLSPGLPRVHPLLQEADRRGLPVVSEVELAWLYRPGFWVCVTGTDGKTTTTTLLGRIFAEAGRRTLTAGNIGVGLCGALLDCPSPPEVVVAELSSFQLETVRTLRPSVAVLLNITPDHLDRYASMEDYAAAKARLWMNQGPEDVLVVRDGDEWTERMLERFPPRARVVRFSARRGLAEGVSLRWGRMVLRGGGRAVVFGRPGRARLRGVHNVENMLAAGGAALLAGLPAEAVRRTIESFPGVEHRFEEVARLGGRLFVNDSKATTVNAVRAALESVPGRRTVLLMGGRSKGDDFRRLAETVRRKARLLVCFGEAAEEIRGALEDSGVRTLRAPTMEEAVRLAWRESRRGEVVLLSPGCTSFDAFRNFEERGRAFKAVVAALAAEGGR